METSETFPATETNPTDFAKRIQTCPKLICAKVSGIDQRAAKQMGPVKIKPSPTSFPGSLSSVRRVGENPGGEVDPSQVSWGPGVTFLGTYTTLASS